MIIVKLLIEFNLIVGCLLLYINVQEFISYYIMAYPIKFNS